MSILDNTAKPPYWWDNVHKRTVVGLHSTSAKLNQEAMVEVARLRVWIAGPCRLQGAIIISRKFAINEMFAERYTMLSFHVLKGTPATCMMQKWLELRKAWW